MHIAFLTPEYPHSAIKHSAGIGSSIKNLATALVEDGHEITLFVYGQLQNQRFSEKGIHFHLIKQKRYSVGGFYLYRKYIQKYINHYSKSIDILEAVDWTGMTAFCKFTIPHVIRLHGSDTYFCHLENRPQKKKNYLFEKWALKKPKAITSVSAFTAQTTKELFGLENEITVIPNLINLENFRPVHTKSEITYILNFGSVIRKKGVIALAMAFNVLAAQLPDVQLKYLGKDVKDVRTGKMTSELIRQEIDAAYQHRVEFIDQVAYEEVNKYINAAAVVCLPSYAEAFPMTWLEAMALEKPLVTSNIGWSPELMMHEHTGLTIDPDDTKLFTDALRRMLENREFARNCGVNARHYLESHFSKKKILNQNKTFYNTIIHV
jgi:glycosyltransferase involved in cell wall biosynthesis